MVGISSHSQKDHCSKTSVVCHRTTVPALEGSTQRQCPIVPLPAMPKQHHISHCTGEGPYSLPVKCMAQHQVQVGEMVVIQEGVEVVEDAEREG